MKKYIISEVLRIEKKHGALISEKFVLPEFYAVFFQCW
jgi:hypothetical protein